MRTSLSIPDDTMNLIIECAEVQNRTIAGQLRHLITSHPELVGMSAFKRHAEIQEMLIKGKDIKRAIDAAHFEGKAE